MLTREEAALLEVGVTEVTGPMKRVLAAAFLAVLASVPAAQVVGSVASWAAGKRASPVPQPFDIFLSVPVAARAGAGAPGSPFHKVFAANRVLLGDINQYEDDLEKQSYLGACIRPPAQYLLASRLGSGNEKAYVGRHGWLFYRPGLDYLTGPGFLEPKVLAQRAATGSEYVAPPQPDPRKAVRQFHAQLEERGIALVVVPTPVKPCIHPEQFGFGYGRRAAPLQSPSYEAFLEDLERAGVLVFDPGPVLLEAKRGPNSPQYLATDTHWRPEAMERAAAALAPFIQARVHLPPVPPPKCRIVPATVRNTGDVAALLDLPSWQRTWPPEEAAIRQVLYESGLLWQSDPSADVLFLGDSFSNVYSLEAMGWGEAAGFPEHLALALGRPLDRIVRNDDGAFATRGVLSTDLARGRDRLAGKRVVIWQFADRELAIGNWKLLPMQRGAAPDDKFLVPEPGRDRIVTGTIAAAGGVPKPGAVTYRDHIRALHLVDLRDEKGPMEGGQAVVYIWSMRNSQWTEAARFRPGDVITVRLRPWDDVVRQLGGINRSELQEPALQLQPANWGELVKVERRGDGAPGRAWPVLVVAGVLGMCLAARLFGRWRRV
jgi:alginate O-acetyltransferase complex protein AlgJ